MTTTLNAWAGDTLVGRFEFFGDGPARFTYEPDAPFDVSLSLPRGARHAASAASNYLANLLPEERAVQKRMAALLGLPNATRYELLRAVGRDLPGGLTLLSPLASPGWPISPCSAVTDASLAERIRALRADPDAWVSTADEARFALSGTQGKFALTRADGVWLLPTPDRPSTHILKPARAGLDYLEEAEAAALTLARRIGLEASAVSVEHAAGERVFVTERFDRPSDLGEPTHVEDLAQSLGVKPDSKYHVAATRILRHLAPHDPDQSVRLTFVDQLAFKTILGDVDAHAKNSAIRLTPAGVRMAPLYDVIPLGLYPQFDQGLVMEISGADRAHGVGLPHWRKLATKSGLDASEVEARVRQIAADVVNHGDAWDLLPEAMADRMRAIVDRNTEKLLQ